MISQNELVTAWGNVLRAKDHLGCQPNCWVSVNDLQFTLGKPGTGSCSLECMLPEQLLRDILDRKVSWNAAEIGCLIRFNRVGPYMPDVHTLLSFFHLPRPT